MAIMRSPNYPSIGLPEAVKVAQMLWDKEKKTAVSLDVVAKAIGYTSVSGNVRAKVAALRKYGLLEQNGGNYRLSDLAITILHGEPNEKKQALAASASRPESFRELYGSHADASDDALKSYLLTKKNFSESGARQFIKAFRDTLSISNPTQLEYSPQDGEDDMATDNQSQRDTSNNFSLPSGGARRSNLPGQYAGRTFTWPLSKGVTAEVRFTGGAVTEAHIDVLTKYLDLAKAAIATEDETEEG